MKHHASPEFWAYHSALPEHIRRLADRNFELLKSNRNHPSLRLKKIGPLWSVRVGRNYRALARSRGEDAYFGLDPAMNMTR